MGKALDSLKNYRQRLFVLEYTKDLNATQAAIRAGYAERSARNQANRMMTNDDIRAAISEAFSERAERTKIDSDRVVREIANLLTYDPRDLLSWGPNGFVIKDSSELSEDQAKLVQSVSESPSQWGWRRQVKFYDRLKAAELLGRHLGMFTGQVEIHQPVKGRVRMMNVRRQVRRSDSEGEPARGD